MQGSFAKMPYFWRAIPAKENWELLMRDLCAFWSSRNYPEKGVLTPYQWGLFLAERPYFCRDFLLKRPIFVGLFRKRDLTNLIVKARDLCPCRLYESRLNLNKSKCLKGDFFESFRLVRVPVVSRRGHLSHETFFLAKHLYQAKKKSRVGNAWDEIRLGICPIWIIQNNLRLDILIS